jgi:addiction module RelE/StbE family toxin
VTLRWSREARQDLDDIDAYIAADKPDAARKVIAGIRGAVEQLKKHPHMGRAGRLSGTRELIDAPFVIVYVVAGNTVQIVTVFHGSKLWPPKKSK